MERLTEKAAAAVREFSMTDGADAVVCALSGGADSVSLLRVMKLLAESFSFEVFACHLNHGLRGEESDRDERFCRELCGQLDIPLFSRKADISSMREKHESTEQAARRVRYGFFAETLEKIGKSGKTPVLATAHTASDNAETVIFNLTRGTGLNGLCGIPPVRTLGRFRVVRPLIRASRADVEDFLGRLGQDFVTDKTNLSDEFSRNRIRLNVMPQLAKINPAVAETVSRATENLRRDNDYLCGIAENALNEAKCGRGWKASELAKLPEPIKARAVAKILTLGNIQPSELRIKTASELLEKYSAKYNPCKNRFFLVRKGVCFTEETTQFFHGYNEKR